MKNRIQKRIRIAAMAICAGIACVQIAYAIIWAIRNGNHIQTFYDTSLYLSGAQSLVSDGWRLIGYSLFLRVFMLFEVLLGDYYVVLLYIVQVGISLYCYAVGCKIFAKLVWGKDVSTKKMLFPAIYIVTIPVVWQMQFAILPDALCMALTVLVVVSLAEILWNDKNFLYKKVLILMMLCLLIGFLHRHYLYAVLFMTVTVLILALVKMVRKKYRNKAAAYTLAMLCGCMLVAFAIPAIGNSMISENGEYASYSVSADLWKRFVYPNLYEDYPFYAEDISAVISEEVVKECDNHYESYMVILKPMLEKNGAGEAERISMELVKTGFGLHKREMIEGLAKEGITYATIPFFMKKYMYNNGDSLYGYNLIRMYAKCPNLASDYMHIGMNGFLVVSLLGLCMCFLDFIWTKERRIKWIKVLIYCGVSIICITTPLMIFAIAKFDYRIGLFSVFVWSMLAGLNVLAYDAKRTE